MGDVAEVQLHHLVAGDRSGVLDADADLDGTGSVDGSVAEHHLAVGEGRVAEAVSEREERCGRQVAVALVHVGLGGAVAAAVVLTCVDRNLAGAPGNAYGSLPPGLSIPNRAFAMARVPC